MRDHETMHREALAMVTFNGERITRALALPQEQTALDVLDLLAELELRTEQLRIQAASNRALVVECDRYRELLIKPMDLRVKDALVKGTP